MKSELEFRGMGFSPNCDEKERRENIEITEITDQSAPAAAINVHR
jgi:hypothetical protein